MLKQLLSGKIINGAIIFQFINDDITQEIVLLSNYAYKRIFLKKASYKT